MSVSEGAEKLWFYIKTKDLEEVTSLLDKKSHSEIKQICELEVNKIVWPLEQNHRDSFSCLHYGAKKGRIYILEELFNLQGTDNDTIDVNLKTSILGWTPLHYASYGGNFQTVKLLIQQGANMNVASKDGTTPIHVAVYRCMKRSLVGLVNCGASVNQTDDRGYTPLHMCIESLHNSMCTELECKEMVEFFLTRGCNPFLACKTGDLPLHMAIRYNVQANLIRLLASSLKRYGVDAINHKNSMGFAPIHLCSTVEQTQHLIAYGAKINLQTDTEQTTLLHASTTNLDLVKHIVTNGGDKMVTDKEGQIALHVAVSQQCPNIEVVKLLSSDYKNVVAKDKLGETVLHKLCANNYKILKYKDEQNVIREKHLRKTEDPILEYLITERGANVDEKNSSGQTPLHKTIQLRYLHKATLLVMHGADLDLVDNKNTTPRKMDPAWARRALASLEFTDLDSQYSGSTARTGRKPDGCSLNSNETTSTMLSGSSVNNKSSLSTTPAPLPIWVKNDTNKNKTNTDVKTKTKETSLNREMTLLQTEVQDVKDFLEEFSKEGESSRSSKTTSRSDPRGIDRQLTRLHEEVNDLNKMLQEVS